MRRFAAGGLLALALTAGCAIASGERSANRSAKAAAQVEEQIGLVDNEPLREYVIAIGERLAQGSTRADVAYKFDLLDMSAPNAFALPDGHIYVSRGLLSLMNEEDELAAVIGHELGHVAARHHIKQTLRDVPLAPLRIATGLGGALAGVVSPLLGRTIAGTGQLTSAIVHAPYSRDQEREADRIGQQLVADAGWDPAALASFMHTLGREQELLGGDPNHASFLATHPASEERSRAAVEQARSIQRTTKPPISADRRAFLSRLEGLLVGKPASEGVFAGNDFLHAGLAIAWTLPDGWEQVNEDRFVGALDRENDRGIVLLVAAEGDDPMETAKAGTRRLRMEQAPAAVAGNDFGAVRARALDGAVRAELTWLAKNGLVFLINGFAPSDDPRSTGEALRSSADSFRALSPADRERIREQRLDVVQALGEETLTALLDRNGSLWPAEEAAVANAILPDSRLESGQWIKITRPTRVESHVDSADGSGED